MKMYRYGDRTELLLLLLKAEQREATRIKIGGKGLNLKYLTAWRQNLLISILKHLYSNEKI